jgi:carboxymethylenebutenolidase
MPGWDEWTCEVARKFAHHGYAAVAPSLYFRVGDGADEAVVAKVRGDGGNPDDQIAGDVAGAVAFLREQSHASGKVGIIGFFSGGLGANYAASGYAGFGVPIAATSACRSPKRNGLSCKDGGRSYLSAAG